MEEQILTAASSALKRYGESRKPRSKPGRAELPEARSVIANSKSPVAPTLGRASASFAICYLLLSEPQASSVPNER